MSGKEAPRIKWLIEPHFEPDADGVLHQTRAGLDWNGKEYGDQTPVRPPAGLNVGTRDTLGEEIRRIIRQEQFRQAVEKEGFETFEESEDFDVEDDIFPIDPHTPYEAVFDPPASGASGNGQKLASEAVKAENRAAEHATPPPGVLVEEYPIDRTASAGSASQQSKETMVGKQSESGSKVVASGTGKASR